MVQVNVDGVLHYVSDTVLSVQKILWLNMYLELLFWVLWKHLATNQFLSSFCDYSSYDIAQETVLLEAFLFQAELL